MREDDECIPNDYQRPRCKRNYGESLSVYYAHSEQNWRYKQNQPLNAAEDISKFMKTPLAAQM